MTTWEKIKEFKENHEKEITRARAMGFALAYGLIWYQAGKRSVRNKLGRGLERCILVNPEIKTMIDEASEEVRKRTK